MRKTVKWTTSRAAPECHPLVHAFDALQRRRGDIDKVCSFRGNVSPVSPSNWRRGHEPGLIKFDRTLRGMGYRLAIVPLDGRPDEPVMD